MTQIVFETDGEIDIRAFTAFGINVKPNTDSPIGYFGTGLKYAVSILTRGGSNRMRVLIGKVEYEFYCKTGSFRDVEFDFLKMRKRNSLLGRWQYHSLPFTTEFGKNWEMWQAFRELESNTRDEGGSTYTQEDDIEVRGESGKTKIIISNDEFVDCYAGRDEIFLPIDELQLITKNHTLEVYEGKSSYIYFRGLRVQYLNKSSLHTYNFTSKVDLTEDRTIKFYHYELGKIAECIMNSTNTDFINSIIRDGEEKDFESDLNFDTHYSSTSSVFMSAVGVCVSSGSSLLPRVGTLYENAYPELVEIDPDVEITMKRSEWASVYEIMRFMGLDNTEDQDTVAYQQLMDECQTEHGLLLEPS